MLSRRHFLEGLAGIAVLGAGGVPALAKETPPDHARITRLIGEAHELPTISQRIDLISRKLIGSRYRGYTLIGGPRKAEQFVTRDDVFDCVTYCETVLAAAMARTPERYETALRQIRYHHGVVEWRARNHYFAEWCANNIAGGFCRAVALPGAETRTKTISYMRAYGARPVHLDVVPRASLIDNRQLLATGDIIGFLSRRPGVDYFHTGFVIVAPDGALWLRHAAQSQRRVLDEPMARFLAANRVGAVTVLRAREAAAG
jgi:hypothetical protein